MREIRYGRLAAGPDHATVAAAGVPATSFVSESARVVGNLVILLVLAALAGASALVLFSVLGRVESRAHWKREEGIKRSRQLERRAFVVGVIIVAGLVVGWAALYLNRTPSCKGKIVIIKGPHGPLECVCEKEKLGACFEPGP